MGKNGQIKNFIKVVKRFRYAGDLVVFIGEYM